MVAVTVAGIPGIEAEENFEEDSHRPLINDAENEDEYEPNYSIQEGSTITQVGNQLLSGLLSSWSYTGKGPSDLLTTSEILWPECEPSLG